MNVILAGTVFAVALSAGIPAGTALAGALSFDYAPVAHLVRG